MRKFLCEYETIYTMEELEKFFHTESDDREYMTFAQWLADCMGKNGSLREILTLDTPRGEQLHALSLCRVQYSEDEDDYCEEWLTPTEICEKWRDGCGVKFLI